MADSSLRVQPGDVVTSDLFNNLLTRVALLESQTSDIGLRLGALAADTHTLVALGTGFESGGGIWLDGDPLLSVQTQAGIHLVILDGALRLKFKKIYDVSRPGDGATKASDELAAVLRTQTSQYDLVIVVTHESYAGLSPHGRAALASVGGASLAAPGRERDNAAFIGVVPANNTDQASFDYLISVIPADIPGTGAAQVAGLPFVWGVYSVPMRRFLMGGVSGAGVVLPIQSPKGGEGKDAAKDSKDGKDAKDAFKEGKEASKDTKDNKDSKDGTKEGKEATKDTKDIKDRKDNTKDRENKGFAKDKDVVRDKVAEKAIVRETVKLSDALLNPGLPVETVLQSGTVRSFIKPAERPQLGGGALNQP
jgi:hypothetical protein